MPPPPAEDRLFHALLGLGLGLLLVLAAWVAAVGPPVALGAGAAEERLFAVLRAPPPDGLPPAPPPPARRPAPGGWGPPAAAPAPPAAPLTVDELLGLLRVSTDGPPGGDLARALEITPELRAALEAAEAYDGEGLPTGARASADGGGRDDGTAGPLRALGGAEVVVQGPRPGQAGPARAAALPAPLRRAPPRLPPAAHAALAREARGGVARCLTAAPEVRRVELRLEIAGGQLRAATFVAPSPPPPALEACLRARLRLWVFPEGFTGEDRFVFIPAQ